jgi:hypothetical protein
MRTAAADNETMAGSHLRRGVHPVVAPILDPRLGDFENDHSATKQRSLLAIAGSLLGEISVTKLAFSWLIQFLFPAVLLGMGPLILTAWIGEASSRLAEATGFGAALIVLAALAVAWFGWRPLFRLIESNFWSLTALTVQPGYAFWRELIRHVAEGSRNDKTGAELARMRAASCAAAGVLLCFAGALVAVLVWPATRWTGAVADLLSPHLMIVPTIANTIVVMSTSLAVAALIWTAADASASQPLDLNAFDVAPAGARVWRVAHLSDIHIVGERYGFRIECGRAGPRGNGRLRRALNDLAALHAERPLDLILVTGDMTDAGAAAEWAEFFDIFASHPELASRMLIVPGNHDINIVDRTNPARLELPFSQLKTLRRMRALSAIKMVQGDRVRAARNAKETTLADMLAPHHREIELFADEGGFRLSARLMRLWGETFPQILPPAEENGLGVAILDSNADTNFSFTNALGMISAGQAHRLTAAFDRYPRAGWIVALHHHVTEYPRPVSAFSERVSTALVNGSWFQRVLKPNAERIVIMHGHRHVDWIGACGTMKIVSAPSPVMKPDGGAAHFYVHALTVGPDGRLRLLRPERLGVAADSEALQLDDPIA